MIVIDTNVISEVMRRAPAPDVVAWLDHQATEDLYITTVTIAEIAYGLRALPNGARRRDLSKRFAAFLARGFEDRVLSFDQHAANEYADIMGHRKEIGRPMGILDGQIAAITRCRGMRLATRNIRDFEECGVEVVNPFNWEQG